MDIPRPSCALVFLLLLIIHLTECMNGGKINFREKEKQILDQILGPGRYDARIRPSGINGTGKSSLRLQLHSVRGGSDSLGSRKIGWSRKIGRLDGQV
uniref:SFRICE_025555 n=1 Tax=Spodoptera frugiperda TaxID=7108 RepID=A0A2H1WCG1_SPOFR